MVVSGIWSVSHHAAVSHPHTPSCHPAPLQPSQRECRAQSPTPKIMKHPTGYERFLLPAPHVVPLQGQGQDKDTACIATTRVSYLNLC